MASGARVHLFIGAANRDPRIFKQPDDFDIRRANARKFIDFGYGIHMFLGTRLARMEATIAFPILVRALGNAELTTDALQWSDSLVVRGLRSLPVRRCIA